MRRCKQCKTKIKHKTVICPVCGCSVNNPSAGTSSLNAYASKNAGVRAAKVIFKTIILLIVLFAAGVAGILIISSINSACSSYVGDFSQRTGYTVKYEDKVFEITPYMHVRDLELSGLDVTYYNDEDEVFTSPDYEFYYDELYATNCIQEEICRLKLTHSEYSDVFWLELHFHPDDIPEEDFPIKAGDCPFFFVTADERIRPRWFQFNAAKKYAQENPVRIEGIEPYMSIGEVKQLLGKPVDVSLNIPSFPLRKVYTFENAANQQIDVIFSIFGNKVLYVSAGVNPEKYTYTESGDILVDYGW